MKKFSEFMAEAKEPTTETIRGHKVGDHVHITHPFAYTDRKTGVTNIPHGKIVKVTKHHFHVKWNGSSIESKHAAKSGLSTTDNTSAHRNIVPGKGYVTGKAFAQYDSGAKNVKHMNPED